MSVDYTSYSEDFQTEFVDDVVIADEALISQEDQTMMGVIHNTQKVYLRKEASKESPHVAVLNKDDEVMIDGVYNDDLGNGWYHLITASGNEGYTMSDFVKIVE